LIVSKLNGILEAEQFDSEQVEFYISLPEEKYNFKIQLIDCKFYNEEKLIEAQIKNKKGLELQDFYIPESRSALLRESQSL
jgi:hypothetical protein